MLNGINAGNNVGTVSRSDNAGTSNVHLNNTVRRL